ncbi:Maf family nucleotide pyrophosphatase [Ornithobacterium rhinotracheale]
MLLQDKLKGFKLILGSQSPRREELLRGLCLDFKTQPLHADESYSAELKAENITEFLCRVKAEAFQFYHEKQILITADTIVWLEDRALEKPKNRGEAIAMLKALSGKTHEVISSVGITSTEKQIVFSDKTKVQFSTLNDEEIEFYVDTFHPFDKADAYGVQEWIGYVGVEKLEGSYFTVMGLPVHRLYQALKDF